MRTRSWTVRLSEPASADFREIFRWTATRFGLAQANAYAETISAALNALRRGPNIIGVKKRFDVAKGLYTLHVSREGRRGRHVILFRIEQQRDRPTIGVGRILHEAMDLVRHLPVEDSDPER